jgi:hypothetical protein
MCRLFRITEGMAGSEAYRRPSMQSTSAPKSARIIEQ